MTQPAAFHRPSLSYEVFPPNTQVGAERLTQTLNDLAELAPDFISVTCSNRQPDVEATTLKVADHVQNTLQIPTIAHLPAMYLSKEQVASTLAALDRLGIRRVLALRGDVIEGLTPVGDFRYADELIHFIRAQQPHFDVTAACYPEVHPDSPNAVQDIRYLKQKVDAGADRLITQLFFDNDCFYQFQEKCALANIDVPILAGIMPIINRNQALRLLSTCETTKLPRKFKAILDKYEHEPEALRAAGLAYALDQIVDLITQDADGIHLYTMNHSDTARYIAQSARALFR